MHTNVQLSSQIPLMSPPAWVVIDDHLNALGKFRRLADHEAWTLDVFGARLSVPFGGAIRVWLGSQVLVAYHDIYSYPLGGQLVVAYIKEPDHDYAWQVFETLRNALVEKTREEGK